MKQHTKLDNTSRKNVFKKQEKKISEHFSKLNTNEISIVYEILDEYERLRKFGEKPPIFSLNQNYVLSLEETTKKSKKGSRS